MLGIVATAYGGVIAQVRKPEPLHKHLKDMVAGSGGQHGFQAFMNRVQRWKNDKDMGPDVEVLNAARRLPAAERLRIVTTFMECQTDRIYRIMQEVVREFDNRHDMSQDDNRTLSHCFHRTIEVDRDHPKRLNPYAQKIAVYGSRRKNRQSSTSTRKPTRSARGT